MSKLRGSEIYPRHYNNGIGTDMSFRLLESFAYLS
jgi:hypothetical protein